MAHEFSTDVIRPAASEWDEREETPWPIIQEAAKAGIYSLDFFASIWGDESGISLPITMEELFWGDAGIGLSIVGTTLGVAGILGNGTMDQIGEWVPQCFGTPDDVKMAALAVSEPNAGSDVSSMKTTAVYDEAKDQWTLNGVKTWITNGGIADVHVVVATVDPDAQGPRAGARSSSARSSRARGSRWARSSRSTASAPATPPRSSWTTSCCRAARCWARRASSTSGWPATASDGRGRPG